MDDIKAELAVVDADLKRNIEEFRAAVASGCPWSSGTTPEQARDVNGRPILADLLAARANVLSALSRLQ